MTVTWFDGVTLELSFTPLKGGGDTVVDADFTGDITASLRGSVSIAPCGRATERDTFQSGTMVFKVDARSRLMDPDYSSGTYFGNLKPNRHVRFRMTYSGSTSYLFHGYIDGYPPDWDMANTDGTVTITAHCWFKLAARCALPESAYAYEVKADTPTSWYRLGDAATSTVAKDSSGNNLDGTLAPTLSTPTAGLIELSDDGARSVPNGGGTTFPLRNTGYVSGTAWTWEAWLVLPTITGSNSIWEQLDSSGVNTFAVSIGSGGTSLAVTTRSAGTGAINSFWTLTSAVTDGARHHFAVVKSGTTLTLYIDGAATAWTSGGTGLSSTDTDYGGATTRHLALGFDGPWTVDELATYGTALSAARILAHYQAGTTAYAGDTVSARITRVLGMTRYASFPTSLDTSVVTVRGCDFGGGTVKLLDYLQTLERTEGGQARLFVSPDGTLTFHARYHDSLAPTVTTAFSDLTGTTLPYTAIDFDGLSDQRVVNDVQVTRTNGTAQRVSDATSDVDNGTLSLVVSGVDLQTDAEALDMANGLLYLYKDPHPRVRSLVITPRSAPTTLMPVVRTTVVGTRISARRLPIIGSAWTREATVEGVQHTIDPERWVTRYLTAPADLTGSWWILGDATYGILGTARLGF